MTKAQMMEARDEHEVDKFRNEEQVKAGEEKKLVAKLKARAKNQSRQGKNWRDCKRGVGEKEEFD